MFRLMYVVINGEYTRRSFLIKNTYLVQEKGKLYIPDYILKGIVSTSLASIKRSPDVYTNTQHKEEV
jgi:hypothetical protein